MIDAHAFARMLMVRIQRRREDAYQRLATGLAPNEYHKLCGMVAEDDALIGLIEEVRTRDHEDDDDPDPLTDKKRNGKQPTARR